MKAWTGSDRSIVVQAETSSELALLSRTAGKWLKVEKVEHESDPDAPIWFAMRIDPEAYYEDTDEDLL